MSRLHASFMVGIPEIDQLRFVEFPARKTAITHVVRVDGTVVARSPIANVVYYRARTKYTGLHRSLPHGALETLTACAKLGIISKAALTALSAKDAKRRARLERHTAAVELRAHAKLLGIKLTKRQEMQRDKAEAGQ